eukprot:COSAG01_NODE_11418_length_1939_cov_1.242391_3_plen_45_part_00
MANARRDGGDSMRVVALCVNLTTLPACQVPTNEAFQIDAHPTRT